MLTDGPKTSGSTLTSTPAPTFTSAFQRATTSTGLLSLSHCLSSAAPASHLFAATAAPPHMSSRSLSSPTEVTTAMPACLHLNHLIQSAMYGRHTAHSTHSTLNTWRSRHTTLRALFPQLQQSFPHITDTTECCTPQRSIGTAPQGHGVKASSLSSRSCQHPSAPISTHQHLSAPISTHQHPSAFLSVTAKTVGVMGYNVDVTRHWDQSHSSHCKSSADV